MRCASIYEKNMKLEGFSVQEWNWEIDVVEQVFICEHQNILYSFTCRCGFPFFI
jgi:hypothetical protein